MYEQPQQYQQPMYGQPARPMQKVDDVTPFCDKLREFLCRFSLNRSLIGASEILTYISVAACFVMSVLFVILDSASARNAAGGGLTFSTYMPYICIYFSVLAFANRKPLAAAITFSYLALMAVLDFILTIIMISSNFSTGSVITGFICLLVEMAILTIITIRAWKAFAVVNSAVQAAKYAQQAMYQQQMAAQQPMMYVQQPVQAAPVQQPAPQPVPVQAAPVQQPVAPVQAAPAQPAAPSAKVCTSCSFENAAESKFCKKCGTKLG